MKTSSVNPVRLVGRWKQKGSRMFGLHIHPTEIHERMGPICESCGLPTPDHFRGSNGVRFMGCEAARIRERERAAR